MNKKHILTSNQVVKGLTYIALVLLALCIVVPVGWVFLASFKENVEFYDELCYRNHFSIVFFIGYCTSCFLCIGEIPF